MVAMALRLSIQGIGLNARIQERDEPLPWQLARGGTVAFKRQWELTMTARGNSLARPSGAKTIELLGAL